MKIKNEKSFTLMEAIVAIFVITTGIVGVLSLVTQTISSATFSKDKLIAAYLAQEGIEVIRNIRDTNWLEEAVWDDGLMAAPNYGVDYQTQALPDLTCSNEGYLEFDGNFYSCSANPDTKFKRKITISDGPVSGSSLNIKVEVSWQEKGAPHKVEAQENLYDWK